MIDPDEQDVVVRRLRARLTGAADSRVILNTAFITPCAQIEPEGVDVEGIKTLDKRWHMLSREVPLLGAEALARGPYNELRLVSRLRAELP